MKRSVLSLAFALVLGATNSAFAVTKAEFHDGMRKLWEDHVAWTRMYIISAAAGLPDTQLVANRLLANQTDIGNAIEPFYGRAAADQLTALLRDHILIAAELVGAAKAGDNAKVGDAKTRWYANANDIASFLHKANPKQWPLDTLQGAMKAHLDQTLDEATHRLQANYGADIKDYEEIVHHILMMADVLSNGIIKQQPSKFKK